MEGTPEQRTVHKPEKGEQLRINSIVIPAGDELALRQDQIGTSDLAEYQSVVGGLIERVGLDNPSASLYLNEEGKLLELPLNRRATLLMWMHNRALRYADLVVGDALLVGPVNRKGYDTDVPEDLARQLFETERFRAEVQVHGEAGWHGNDRRFATWVDAYGYVLDLGRRWTSVQDVRVVPDA